jgi:hypothetical protein
VMEALNCVYFASYISSSKGSSTGSHCPFVIFSSDYGATARARISLFEGPVRIGFY